MKIPKPKSKKINSEKHTRECPICQKVFISSSDQDVERQYNAHYYFKHSNEEEDDWKVRYNGLY